MTADPTSTGDSSPSAPPDPGAIGTALDPGAIGTALDPGAIGTAPGPAVTATISGRFLPRGLTIGMGLAAGVVVAAGIHAIPDIIGPIFLALVLIITVDPLRGWMIRHGAPRWVATLVVIIGVFSIIIGLIVATLIGIAQLVTILPQYADKFQAGVANLQSWLAGLGINQATLEAMFKGIDKSGILDFVGVVLKGILGVLTSLLFIVVLLIFLAVDGSQFGDRRNKVRAGREPVLGALNRFAVGTRSYFGVATVFGLIVAVLDGIALLIIGIPGAALWALLAFVTNYVPNIGFIIGLIPPALIALLDGGVPDMLMVIGVYAVLNFIIQSVLQPKFVGDAVGLTATMSFLSLIVWTYLLGPVGAILAVPASLLFKAIFVDVDPDARWLQLFLGDEPVFKQKKKRGHHAAPGPEPAELVPVGSPAGPQDGPAPTSAVTPS